MVPREILPSLSGSALDLHFYRLAAHASTAKDRHVRCFTHELSLLRAISKVRPSWCNFSISLLGGYVLFSTEMAMSRNRAKHGSRSIKTTNMRTMLFRCVSKADACTLNPSIALSCSKCGCFNVASRKTNSHLGHDFNLRSACQRRMLYRPFVQASAGGRVQPRLQTRHLRHDGSLQGRLRQGGVYVRLKLEAVPSALFLPCPLCMIMTSRAGKIADRSSLAATPVSLWCAIAHWCLRDFM